MKTQAYTQTEEHAYWRNTLQGRMSVLRKAREDGSTKEFVKSQEERIQHTLDNPGSYKGFSVGDK